MKKFALLLVFLICIRHSYGQSIKVQQQIIKAVSILEHDKSQDAVSLFKPIIGSCQSSHDFYDESWAWIQLADHIKSDQKTNSYRLDCLKRAYRICKLHDTVMNLHDIGLSALRNMADIHIQQRNYVLAETEMTEILKPETRAPHQSVLFTYDLFTSLYLAKGDYNKALYYALKTVKTMQASDMNYGITFYNRLAKIYGDLGNATESESWARKAFELARQERNWMAVSVYEATIARNLINQGKSKQALNAVLQDFRAIAAPDAMTARNFLAAIAECYIALKQFPKAEGCYRRMLSLVENPANKFVIGDKALTCQQIGQFYFFTGKLQLARQYQMEALADYEVNGKVVNIKNICLAIAKSDSALGDYKHAMAYMERSNTMKDIMFNAEKNKQIETLQIAYKTEQKNKDIKALHDSAKIQQLKLENVESTRNWIIGLSCLLLIIAGLLYRQAQTARKTSTMTARHNELLQRLVKEKEWLLKEVHHRVKNNLHTIICLLESQTKFVQNEALTAIESTYHRIYAISLIHQKLYRSENVRTIDMAEYIPELLNNLDAAFDVSNKISLHVSIAPVRLDVSTAIPLALIINEAVTNALKYAFPGANTGDICITLLDQEGRITLAITDNGIGISKLALENSNQTLGISLMKGLSEDIDAIMSIENNGGTRIQVIFAAATAPAEVSGSTVALNIH